MVIRGRDAKIYIGTGATIEGELVADCTSREAAEAAVRLLSVGEP